MSVSNLLNRTTAPSVIRFFDVCFKRGVLDAYEFGDELAAQDFVNERLRDWNYCLLGKDLEPTWHDFQFCMYWWARKSRLSYLADNYIFRLRSITYTWCIVPYCYRFYLMGIQEWIQYPNPVNLEIFKGKPKVHWSPDAGVKTFMRGDYFSHMHDIAHDYMSLPDKEKKASDSMMDAFCKALYALSRKY